MKTIDFHDIHLGIDIGEQEAMVVALDASAQLIGAQRFSLEDGSILADRILSFAPPSRYTYYSISLTGAGVKSQIMPSRLSAKEIKTVPLHAAEELSGRVPEKYADFGLAFGAVLAMNPHLH